MKKIGLLVFGLAVKANLLFGQNIKEGNIGFQSCMLPRFCLDCGTQKARMSEDKNGLQQYFEKNFDQSKLKKHQYKGSIMIQVLVDTMGNVCCKSISNNLKNNDPNKIVELQLDKLIGNMPKWIPAFYNNKKENSSVDLRFDFLNNGNYKIDYFSMN